MQQLFFLQLVLQLFPRDLNEAKMTNVNLVGHYRKYNRIINDKSENQ